MPAGPDQSRQDKPTKDRVRAIAEPESETEGSYDGLTERVTEALRPLLKDPSEIGQVVTNVVRITEESYSGPTPHPDHLERIETIAPGAARDIIDMALREQRFRHRVSFLTVLYPYVGLVSGLILSAMLFGISYNLGMAGHTVAASAMVGVSAIGVIGWFIRSRPDDQDLPAASPETGRRTKRRR